MAPPDFQMVRDSIGALNGGWRNTSVYAAQLTAANTSSRVARIGQPLHIYGAFTQRHLCYALLLMVLTKTELIASLQHEVRILTHLCSKVRPEMLDYRPTPKQRSTIELRAPDRHGPRAGALDQG